MNTNKKAFKFYNSLAPGYQKSYLRWLATAKTTPTVLKRVSLIIDLCENEIKTR
ncbi:YdeI/OmpD-associated family protein [Patiriisocius marinus]|uniref:YdeI/OmpD-associated family protein n=1 Tax=Patiriisocius marinus TaxID=1397112 RepID=UPI0013760B8C